MPSISPTELLPGDDDPDHGAFSREGADAPDLPADTLFTVLANPRRRIVIQYVLHMDEAVPKAAVIDRVAAWETQTPVADLSSDARKRAAVSLRHTHLPKLIDAGVVEYNEEEALLTLGPNAAAVEPHLALLAAHRNE